MVSIEQFKQGLKHDVEADVEAAIAGVSDFTDKQWPKPTEEDSY
jgi:hypothetical protein